MHFLVLKRSTKDLQGWAAEPPDKCPNMERVDTEAPPHSQQPVLPMAAATGLASLPTCSCQPPTPGAGSGHCGSRAWGLSLGPPRCCGHPMSISLPAASLL